MSKCVYCAASPLMDDTVTLIRTAPLGVAPARWVCIRCGKLEQERLSELDKAHGKEIGEFQDEVRALVMKLSGAPSNVIDGKGSDAGWQEFTLAEISQAFAWLKEGKELK